MDARLHMFVSERKRPMRANEGPKSGSSTGSRDNSSDSSRGSQKSKPSAGERRLGDFLCFAIYSANLAFGRAYRKGLEDLGLTYPQWIAIVALWEQDGQTSGATRPKSARAARWRTSATTARVVVQLSENESSLMSVHNNPSHPLDY